jgi:hypothetical protein
MLLLIYGGKDKGKGSVKVMLSLCLIDETPRRDDAQRSGCIRVCPLFLPSAQDRGEWSASRPANLSTGKHPRYPFCRRLGVAQSWLGHYG